MKKRFLFVLMALFSILGMDAAINRANNYLYLSPATATAGKTVVVAMNMKNAKDITQFQTNLVLPEGVTIASVEFVNRAADATKNVSELTIFGEMEEGSIAAGDEVVANITLNVASTVAAGEYEIALDKTVMMAGETSIAQTEKNVATLTVEEAQGLVGDVNEDGLISGADIQALLNIIAAGTNDAKGDVNEDGLVSGADIQALLNIIAAQ